MSNLDTKYRASTPSTSSRGNVVDHDAPNVTDGEQPAGPSRTTGMLQKSNGDSHVIRVQPLKRSEMQPSYAQDLGTIEVPHGVYGSMLQALGACVGLCGAVPCCPCPNPFREVYQGSVGLVSRFGKFYKSVDPGLVQVNVCTESLRIVDVKIQISPIGRQKVITRDNVDVEIDSVIYFQITNPYRAAFGISDLRQALIERAQTTLRHVVGARMVQSVVTEREAIAFEIAEIVGDVADKWGVAIEGILIKDIIFSPEVSASLSSAAQQKRIGESKVIAARAEVDAARLMRQAADILASPAAMQIRQLEALQTMAKTANSKVVFVPMNLQHDVVGQVTQQMQASGSGSGSHPLQEESGEGSIARAGLLNSVERI
ncbi:hypothetical protein OH76DRAFT_1398834 [Lentinus brumalis]|uniref:Band 7 domain-containing protein n=1 Tax=Lentinus brumalis TaxID=2498619 RepID=A0A371DMI3_9APHY|nr:hypothetical protein OH76DRAFT_1398834 [Polyporus brumalis]